MKTVLVMMGVGIFSAFLLASLKAEEPARPRVQPGKSLIELNLYAKDERTDGKSVVVVVEIVNNSDETMAVWDSPVLHLSDSLVDSLVGVHNHNRVPSIPIGVTLVYSANLDPQLTRPGSPIEVSENMGGQIESSTKVALSPHSSVYVKAELKADRMQDHVKIVAKSLTCFGLIQSNELTFAPLSVRK
jgi:hypothetical protein